MTTEVFSKFVNEMSKYYDFDIKYKNNSVFMKILGILMFFNLGFMKDYITTIGKTIYFPSYDMIAKNEIGACEILAHEIQHIQQNKKYGFLYPVAYLFPQIFVIFSLLAFFNLWFLLFLICALPLPAIFRMIFEREGYTVTIFMYYSYLEKTYGYKPNDFIMSCLVSSINKQFTSAAYYFMWPFGITNYLEGQLGRIKNGDILSDYDGFYVNARNSFLNSLKG